MQEAAIVWVAEAQGEVQSPALEGEQPQAPGYVESNQLESSSTEKDLGVLVGTQ